MVQIARRFIENSGWYLPRYSTPSSLEVQSPLLCRTIKPKKQHKNTHESYDTTVCAMSTEVLRTQDSRVNSNLVGATGISAALGRLSQATTAAALPTQNFECEWHKGLGWCLTLSLTGVTYPRIDNAF